MKTLLGSLLSGTMTFVAIWMIGCAGGASPVSAADDPAPSRSQPRVYILTCQITIDEESRVKEFHVRKIQDLLSGSRNSVELDLPAPFIAAARKRIEAEKLMPMNGDSALETMAAFLHVPSPETKEIAPGRLNIGLMDGAMAMVGDIKLDDEDWQAAVFDKDLGSSALFLTWYGLPAPARTVEARLSAAEREMRRGLANIQGGVVSKKIIPSDKHAILDCVASHPRTDELRIYQRTLCDGSQLFSITFTGPAELDANLKGEVDALFDSMLFR